MTAPAVAPARPTIRVSPSTIAACSIAALAWGAVTAVARHMGNGIGTMQLSLAEFAGMWALMLTALMLPPVAPTATLYARTIPTGRPRRWLAFVAGYLLVWSSAALPVYAVLRILDRVDSDITVRVVAVAALGAAGVYQLTPLKAMCLRHCRSPLGQLLHYGNVNGPLKELKVAVHHAGYCLGCCWVLMTVFIAFGVMNMWAMVGLAAVVVGEKLLAHGPSLGRLAGAVFLALAVAGAVSPRGAVTIVPSAPASVAPSMSGM